jgi:hypothetical protein
MTAKDFLLHPDNSDKSVVEILDLYAKEKASLAFDAGYKFGLGIGVGSTVPSEYLPDNKKTFLKLHFPNQ